MKPIYGEYDCKLDAKGRFLMPSGLKKQIDGSGEFVVNRGLDDCLVLFPVQVWEQELKTIFSKNQYVSQNRAFARKFMNGATPVNMDGSNRLLVPKRLMEYAGLKKELVLVAAFDRIEIWDKEAYENWLENGGVDMEALSESVMGNLGDSDGSGVS